MLPLILLFSIGLASLEAVELERPQQRMLPEPWTYPQPASPLLSLSSATSNHYNTKLEQQNLQVPIMAKADHQLTASPTSSNNCHNSEVMLNILSLLKNLVSQDANLHIVQPEEKMQVLNFLQHYLANTNLQNNAVYNKQNVGQLINVEATPLTNANNNEATFYNEKPKTQENAETVLKNVAPNIHNEGCKEALTTLLQMINDAHSQLVQYCERFEKCKPDDTVVGFGDLDNILNNHHNTNQLNAAQAQISTQLYPLNVYNAQGSINDLAKPPYQIQAQNQSHQNVKPSYYIQPEAYSNVKKLSTPAELSLTVEQTKTPMDVNHYIKDPIPTDFKDVNGLENFDSIKSLIENFNANQVNKPVSFFDSDLYKNIPQHVFNIHNNIADLAEKTQISQNAYYNRNQIPILTSLQQQHHQHQLHAFQKHDAKLYSDPGNSFQPNVDEHNGKVAMNFLSGREILSPQDNYIKHLMNPNSFVPERNGYNYGGNAINQNRNPMLQVNTYASMFSDDYGRRGVYDNRLPDSPRPARVPNLVKLNPVTDNNGMVELTYALRNPQYLLHEPYYHIKYRLPYGTFLTKVAELSKNAELSSDPMRIYKELASVSTVAEMAPDLMNYEKDELSKFIKNSGTLVNAQLLSATHSNAEEYLKTLRNINAQLNTNDILNVTNVNLNSKEPIAIESLRSKFG